LAEAILDRIIHNSYDIFIDGPVSMREKFGIKETQSNRNLLIFNAVVNITELTGTF